MKLSEKSSKDLDKKFLERLIPQLTAKWNVPLIKLLGLQLGTTVSQTLSHKPNRSGLNVRLKLQKQPKKPQPKKAGPA